MRQRALQIAAFVLLAALGAGLAVALLVGGSGRHTARPLAARTQLSPRDPQFGDTIVARLDVDGGAGSIRVRSDFGPYDVVSRSRSVETVGGATVVRIVTRLRCLELDCLPRKAVKSFRFKPVRVSDGAASVKLAWPALRVHSRITKADSARPVLRVSPPAAAPASYRLPPTATGYVLLVLAGLLAASGAFLLLRVGLRRVAPARRPVPPLERALAELAASSANGDSGRRRRALEELARELEPLDAPLSAESRVLAWGPEEPQADAVTDLTSRVRKEVQR